VDPQGAQQEEFSRAMQAADRAGSIATDGVRSIIDAVQTTTLEADAQLAPVLGASPPDGSRPEMAERRALVP